MVNPQKLLHNLYSARFIINIFCTYVKVDWNRNSRGISKLYVRLIFLLVGICTIMAYAKKYNHYNALWAVTFWWCFENEMQRIRIANKCCINTSSHVSRMQEKDIPKGMENYIHNFIELEACNHIPDIKYTSWFLSSNKEHTFLIYLQPYHNLKKCELNYLVFMRWLMVCGDF